MGYIAARNLDEALGVLAGSDAAVIAGGTDWFPALGERPFAGTLLDISRIAGLRGIARDGAGWRIGGATTWTDVIATDLPPAFDGLKQAAREVGSVQIQNAGTVAGNLCNASPAADGVPPLLTLAAEVELSSRAGVRRLALDAFLQGVRKTQRRPDELLTALFVPAPPDKAQGAFLKLGARKYLVISICMVAVVIAVEDGHLSDVRISVGAASPVAQRMTALETALKGAPVTEAASRVTSDLLPGLSPISDIRATAEYREGATVEMVRRTLAQAIGGSA